MYIRKDSHIKQKEEKHLLVSVWSEQALSLDPYQLGQCSTQRSDNNEGSCGNTASRILVSPRQQGDSKAEWQSMQHWERCILVPQGTLMPRLREEGVGIVTAK